MLVGDDAGGFRSKQIYPVGAKPVEAADTNGDGKVDLVAGGDRRGLAVLLGDHNGHFGPARWLDGKNAYQLDLGDVTGDGKRRRRADR